MNELALKLIKEAKEKNSKTLNLCKNQVTDISFLKDLKQLQKLDLDYNQITDYSFLKGLKQLQILYLRSNQITDISFLKDLEQLQKLDLSSNRITDYSFLKDLKQLQALYLSFNRITDYSFLKDLKQLQALYLDYNQIADISFLKDLKKLRRLGLDSNQIVDISFLKDLKQLQTLDLGSNQIVDISFLKDLKQLQTLDLSSNQITDYSFLKDLKQLQKLDLGLNQITDYSFLKELKQLQKLILGSHQITDYSFLKELKQLQILYLSSKQITDYSFLKELKQLQKLTLRSRSNQITNTSFLKELKQLRTLDLGHNQITDFSFLKGLQRLQKFNLSYNQITNISFLKDIQQLQTLDLSHNQITDISPLIPLIKKGIPVKLKHDYYSGIQIEGNPITNPPLEIIKEGNEAILTYFEQIEKQGGKAPLYEAKLLIVGEPGAGKTTLLKKLENPEYVVPKDGDKNIKSTVGINILEGWNFQHPNIEKERIKINVWDFGGQEIQYMTHHFFITPSALYVLVIDDRKQYTQFDYWFRIINLLGREKDDDKITILVILNEINHQSITNFDIESFRKKYPKLNIIKRDIDFSMKDGRGVVLIDTIKDLLSKLPKLNEPLPLLWKPIRNDLIKLRAKHNHIRFDQFANACNTVRDGIALTETKDQELLSNYLHRIGVLQHYQEFESLYDFMILNPRWAVEAVYSVLRDTRVYDNKGRFTTEDLKEFWSAYSKAEKRNLLDLMLKDKFEICYRSLHDSNTYISPQLLPNVKPNYSWSSEGSLKFRYQYPFMPKGLISRLIVRLNEKIAGECNDLVWKHGIVIEDDNCKGQVIQEKTVKEGLEVLDIEINGEKNQRKFLLHLIRKEIETIHNKSFPHMDYERMIPCNCTECEKSETPHFYEFSELQRYQKKNKHEIVCGQSIEDVPVMGLLEGVFDKESLKQMRESRKRERMDFSQPVIVHNYIDNSNSNNNANDNTNTNNNTNNNDTTNNNINTNNTNITNNTQQAEVPVQLQASLDSELTPISEPPKEQEWYQTWWVGRLFAALGIGVFSLICTGWFSEYHPFSGFLIGFMLSAAFLFYLGNPERRFYKAATMALFSALGLITLQLGFRLEWVQKIENGNVKLFFEYISEYDWLIAILLVVIAAFLFYLDYKKDKE